MTYGDSVGSRNGVLPTNSTRLHFEEQVQLANRVTLYARQNVTIEVHRDANCGVTKTFLNDRRVNPLGKQ